MNFKIGLIKNLLVLIYSLNIVCEFGCRVLMTIHICIYKKIFINNLDKAL